MRLTSFRYEPLEVGECVLVISLSRLTRLNDSAIPQTRDPAEQC
jgi:hypothetical protein